MSKTERKIRNFILKTNTWLCAILCPFSACFVDSESMIPMILLGFSSAWLFLFYYANKDRIERVLADD